MKEDDGVTWETASEVERRYGIPAWVLNKCLKAKRGLFWARNPYTNKMMVCGEMPPEERQQWEDYVARAKEAEAASAQGSGNPLAFLWRGPSDWVELVLWVLLLPISLLMQFVRFLLWINGEIDSACKDVGCSRKYGYWDADCGGLFDAVNDMRRADIRYLFGGDR